MESQDFDPSEVILGIGVPESAAALMGRTQLKWIWVLWCGLDTSWVTVKSSSPQLDISSLRSNNRGGQQIQT